MVHVRGIPDSSMHAFIHSFIHTHGYNVLALESLTASQRAVRSLRNFGQVGGAALCAWGRRGRQYPLPAFLPRYQPQGLSLRPSPHTPAPSLGPSSPRLNTSRLGLLVLFLKVCPPLIHPLLPRPHILVKVPQRQLGQTTGASPHPSSATAL